VHTTGAVLLHRAGRAIFGWRAGACTCKGFLSAGPHRGGLPASYAYADNIYWHALSGTTTVLSPATAPLPPAWVAVHVRACTCSRPPSGGWGCGSGPFLAAESGEPRTHERMVIVTFTARTDGPQFFHCAGGLVRACLAGVGSPPTGHRRRRPAKYALWHGLLHGSRPAPSGGRLVGVPGARAAPSARLHLRLDCQGGGACVNGGGGCDAPPAGRGRERHMGAPAYFFHAELCMRF